jgi:putative hydrolase of the HAD superfamily
MINLEIIRGISLDLDDTLWPVAPTIERAEAALQVWLRANAPLTALAMATVPGRLALREQIQRTRPDILHDMSALRLELIRLALQRCGEDVALAGPAFEVFYAARQDVQLFDDAEPALAFLAGRYPLVALSNGNADVHRVGLGHYFAASFSTRESGVSKPDPRAFHVAAAAASLKPEQILHVGDDAALDVLGALNAGMQAVWVNRSGQAWPHAQTGHVTVSSLSALCDLLR